MKKLKEWYARAPWGNLALSSWGDPQGDPVLLVHGRQDSMSTFMPLLQFLPARYHYVMMDLPGNGKSDAFPTGVMLTRLSSVSAIDVVIRHLKWKKFVYVGHSMGAELGLFYNVMYPGKVSKFILLDVKPGLQRLQMKDFPEYFHSFHEKYYRNYKMYNIDDRKYTEAEALHAVMKARGMTREQAEIILDRNLKNNGDNKFRLSWDRRQKILAPLNLPPEFYIEIFSKNMPPSLYINASQSSSRYYAQEKDAVNRICAALERNRDVWMVDVNGGHDVHFTHPEMMEKDVCAFLDRNFDRKSKL